MRILGIDYGAKRVGLAISSPVGFIAQGLPTIERIDGTDYLEKIADVIEEKEVDEIVVGLPKNMNGSIGEKAGVCFDYGTLVCRSDNQQKSGIHRSGRPVYGSMA